MSLLKSWTLQKAAGAGIVSGCAALILWPLYAAFQERVLPPFLLILAITAFCGISVLAITIIDIAAHRRRGDRLLPIRALDVILGLALAVPCIAELLAILPDRIG
jgi:hypothetical protein